MRKAISLWMGLVILLACVGCGNTQETTWEEPAYPDGYDSVYAFSEERASDLLEHGIYKTREFNGENWFCPVDKLQWQTYGSQVSVGGIWDIDSRDIGMINAETWDDSPFPYIEKGKDTFAIVDRYYLSCTPVLEMGYTVPYELRIDSDNPYRKRMGTAMIESTQYIEQINGKSPSAFVSRLSESYNVIRAEKGEQFTFSYFSGTDYVEETVTADYFYYIVDDDFTELPITKTTNGYFLADLSELSPGYYCFYVDDQTRTIIEVR